MVNLNEETNLIGDICREGALVMHVANLCRDLIRARPVRLYHDFQARAPYCLIAKCKNRRNRPISGHCQQASTAEGWCKDGESHEILPNLEKLRVADPAAKSLDP